MTRTVEQEQSSLGRPRSLAFHKLELGCENSVRFAYTRSTLTSLKSQFYSIIYFTIGEASVLHWRRGRSPLCPLGSNRWKSRKFSCPAHLPRRIVAVGFGGEWMEGVDHLRRGYARRPASDCALTRNGSGNIREARWRWLERPNARVPIP